MMENNKTNLPVTKVGRVGIRLLETKNGVNYQFRLVVPTELRKDGKREKTKISNAIFSPDNIIKKI